MGAKRQTSKADQTSVEKGRIYEGKVVDYLQKAGYQICQQNFRCPFGEVDIIAQKDGAIFFVEVKGQSRDWQAESKINLQKRRRIEMASIDYIRQKGLWDRGIHYDVAVVTGDRIKYYQDAFVGRGSWLWNRLRGKSSNLTYF